VLLLALICVIHMTQSRQQGGAGAKTKNKRKALSCVSEQSFSALTMNLIIIDNYKYYSDLVIIY
jgi:hypothetical protein